jgi:hypothetical protein
LNTFKLIKYSQTYFLVFPTKRPWISILICFYWAFIFGKISQTGVFLKSVNSRGIG